MSFRCSGERASTIPRRRVGRRTYGGMQAQCNYAAGRTERCARGTCGGNRRRRCHDLWRAETGGWRSGTRQGALFGNRKLWGGRNHGALADVQISDRAAGCGIDARRRRNHRNLQSLKTGSIRSTQVRRRSDN